MMLTEQQKTEAQRIVKSCLSIVQGQVGHSLSDDLYQSGWLGVMQAHQRWQPGKARWGTFVFRRALGAMWDEVRAYDHLTPYQRSNVRRLEQERLDGTAWKAPRKVRSDAERLAGVKIMHSDISLIPTKEKVIPDVWGVIRKHGGLAVRTLLAYRLRYWHDMTLDAIGRRLGISGVRVWQIMHKAHSSLRLLF